MMRCDLVVVGRMPEKGGNDREEAEVHPGFEEQIEKTDIETILYRIPSWDAYLRQKLASASCIEVKERSGAINPDRGDRERSPDEALEFEPFEIKEGPEIRGIVSGAQVCILVNIERGIEPLRRILCLSPSETRLRFLY